MDIQVPLYRDAHTPEFSREATNDDATTGSYVDLIEPDTNIHMDAMGFGMGMCCLVSVPHYHTSIATMYTYMKHHLSVYSHW